MLTKEDGFSNQLPKAGPDSNRGEPARPKAHVPMAIGAILTKKDGLRHPFST
jgi:hypothetical protein